MNSKLWVVVKFILRFYVGLRLIGDDAFISDITEAKALSHHLGEVDIYSNSWGPKDKYNYRTFGPVSENALIDGVTLVSIK